MNRASSAPPRVTTVEEDRFIVVNTKLSNSNGCGENSPTSWTQLDRIRMGLMWTWLSFLPIIRAEIWQGYLYVGMWMSPQGSPLSILNPRRWHTTCLRARPAGLTLSSSSVLAVAWEAQANLMLNHMVNRQANGTVRCHLVPPPWKKSWTFGVPPQLKAAIEVISLFFRASVLAADPEAQITEENAFHISWN